jgi:hypothetical protein
MSRALSLTCTALLVVALGGSAFAGKPSIAVLGLEVVDQNGTPTPADTQAAKELSDGLRARAKAGTGPYQLAPGSDKELIDQKLLNNCDNEAAGCMSAIGNQLGSDILMYGHFEKQGKQYQVTIKVLDVSRKAVLKSSSDMIPVAEANGAALQGWAKRIYAKLTGESAGGTLVVKVSNADRGTILVNGDPKGTFSNGSGTVSGLGEGKARISVESEGFRRWEKDVNITSGSITVPVELERGSGEQIGGLGDGSGPGGSDVGGGRAKRGSNTWKAVAVAGLLASAGGVYLWVSGADQIDATKAKLCSAGNYHASDPSCPDMPTLNTQEINDLNAEGDRGKLKTRIGVPLAFGAFGFGVFAVYKGFIAKQDSNEQRHARGKRVRRQRFIVTPVVAPSGAGATVRFDW